MYAVIYFLIRYDLLFIIYSIEYVNKNNTLVDHMHHHHHASIRDKETDTGTNKLYLHTPSGQSIKIAKHEVDVRKVV